MNKLLVACFSTLVAFSSVGTANSNPVAGGVEVAISGSDVKDLDASYGFDVGYYANENIRFRLGYSTISFENSKNIGAASFIEKFDQNNIRLNIDWFPWKRSNGFFVSTGATQLSAPSSLTMKVDPSLTYTLNSRGYTGAQLGSITGSVETKKVVPYLGFGYRYQFKEARGWYLQAEVGSVFGVSPKLQFSSDNPNNLDNINADLQVFADSKNSLLEDYYAMYGLTFGYLF